MRWTVWVALMNGISYKMWKRIGSYEKYEVAVRVAKAFQMDGERTRITTEEYL
jgi:hypothetical protein